MVTLLRPEKLSVEAADIIERISQKIGLQKEVLEKEYWATLDEVLLKFPSDFYQSEEGLQRYCAQLLYAQYKAYKGKEAYERYEFQRQQRRIDASINEIYIERATMMAVKQTLNSQNPICPFWTCQAVGTERHHILYEPELTIMLCSEHHSWITRLNSHTVRKQHWNLGEDGKGSLTNKQRCMLFYRLMHGYIKKPSNTALDKEWANES